MLTHDTRPTVDLDLTDVYIKIVFLFMEDKLPVLRPVTIADFAHMT